MDENKKYLLMNLIQDYVMRTGELPDIKQLQALGMSAPDIIKYLKIYPRGCKSLSQKNTVEYLKGILNKLPELKVINMSGCLITEEIIKELNKSNIEVVIYDEMFFLNLRNFNFADLLTMANSRITFKNSEWFDFYVRVAQDLDGSHDTEQKYDYTNEGVEKYIKDSLKKGFNAQSGLDGLINAYIYGTRYGYQDFPQFQHYRITEKRVINYQFKTLVNIFLKHGAKPRLGMLIPTLDFYNIKTNQGNDIIEYISGDIQMQAMILRTFYEIDKSLIIPQIYNYLPKNWDSIVPLDWQENWDNDDFATTNLQTVIYQDFKHKLYSYDVEV
jgi:hypothetical protein